MGQKGEKIRKKERKKTGRKKEGKINLHFSRHRFKSFSVDIKKIDLK